MKRMIKKLPPIKKTHGALLALGLLCSTESGMSLYNVNAIENRLEQLDKRCGHHFGRATLYTLCLSGGEAVQAQRMVKAVSQEKKETVQYGVVGAAALGFGGFGAWRNRKNKKPKTDN